MPAHIIGMGSFLPEDVLSNQDLEKLVDTSDEWIVSRTGMKERRLAGKEQFASTMGVEAARIALDKAKLDPREVDLILVATMSPDYLFPSTASLIQAGLGATKAAALDVQAACSGYLYALSIAKAYVESKTYKNVLLIATEKMSSIVDYQDRSTCVLFGDGASASLISDVAQGYAINTICLGADGTLADLLLMPAGGTRQPATEETVAKRLHFIKMNGKELFKHAVRRMGAAAQECLEKANLKEEEIAWLVPHQANMRIIDAVAKTFHISSSKIFKTLHKYGNTSASSIAIALDELTQQENIQEGEHLLLVAFGAGLSWGAAILTKI